jgi:exopolysaccharide biosynthesis polyprenyl glycosylphosphotransferase
VFKGEGVTTADIAAAQELDERGVSATKPSISASAATLRGGVERSRWESRYINVLIVTDAVVGIVAAFAALQVKFGSPERGVSYRTYAALTVIVPLAWLLVLALNHSYDTRFLFVGNDEYQRVLRSGLALTAAIAIGSYAVDITVARGYVVIAMPVAITLGVFTRYVQRKVLHRAWGRGRCLRRVILAGHRSAVVPMARQLSRERYHGMEVVATCLPPRPGGLPARLDDVDLPVYGTFDQIAMATRYAGADTVVVLPSPELDGTVLRRLAWQLERHDVDLILANALLDVAGDRTTIRPVDGLPMLHVEHPRLTGARRVAKELVDRIGAGLLLLFFAPLLLALAVVIRSRLGGSGPALFRQVRVGRDGGQFQIFKFRTMYVDAEQRLSDIAHLNENDGVLFKVRDDPRVTPVGRWLRRYSLDELPQLINVVKGDMSLVGPRPPLPSEVAQYPDDMRRRLVVKPGMTGLWQVSGRADLSWEDAIRLDLRYVENWSLTLDLVILLRTITAVTRSSGAY